MKMNCWLILGVMVAASATAPKLTNSLPAIPPPANASPMVAPAPVLATPSEPATNAPVKKAATKKKKSTKSMPRQARRCDEEADCRGDATLTPDGGSRRQECGMSAARPASRRSHCRTSQKGDFRHVLSQITLDKHKPMSPAMGE